MRPAFDRASNGDVVHTAAKVIKMQLAMQAGRIKHEEFQNDSAALMRQWRV
jgi:hypothetical protein